MNVCILVPAADVEKVRESAATLDAFKAADPSKLMNIALSPTGEAPATHYFCAANVSQEVYNKMQAIRKYSEMTTDEAKPWLQSKGLKVIKAS
jgi:hypothetical protein